MIDTQQLIALTIYLIWSGASVYTYFKEDGVPASVSGLSCLIWGIITAAFVIGFLIISLFNFTNY